MRPVEREQAEALFGRLTLWLRGRGVVLAPGATELELARLARERFRRDEPLAFVRGFYLPAVYGQGALMPLAEATRLVDAVCGRKYPAPVAASAGAGPASVSAAVEDSSARCERCGGSL